MPAPYNYLGQLPQVDLGKSFLSSYQTGLALGQTAEALRQRERNEQFKTDFANMLKNPSMQGSMELVAKYPEFADKIQAAKNLYGEEENKREFDYAVKVSRALNTGNIDIAKNLTNEQIQALRSAGKSTAELEQILKGIDANPKAVAGLVGSIGAASNPTQWKSIVEADIARTKAEQEAAKASAEALKAQVEAKYADQVQQANLGKTRAEISNLSSQIADRTSRLKIDTNQAVANIAKLQKELGAIPDAVRKDADAAVIAAGSALTAADQMASLADRIAANSFGAEGVFATADQWLADSLGVGENEVNDIRKEFTRIQNSEIVRNLPPGPATDRDISTVAEGYLKATASPERMESYLRGLEKLRRIEGELEYGKADWLSKNGSLQRARGAMEVGNYQVKPGESFVDFKKRVAGDINAKYAEQSRKRFMFPGQAGATPAGGMPAGAMPPAAAGGEAMATVPAAFGGAGAGMPARPAAEAPATGFTLLRTRPAQR